jgi:hypothetical protein
VGDTDRLRALGRTPLADVRTRIDACLTGATPLTGLDLYFLLERATPLIELHTILRPGSGNRTRSGLQQSYGDHNRLLLLGLDSLENADLDWYRSRRCDTFSSGSRCTAGTAAVSAPVFHPRGSSPWSRPLPSAFSASSPTTSTW